MKLRALRASVALGLVACLLSMWSGLARAQGAPSPRTNRAVDAPNLVKIETEDGAKIRVDGQLILDRDETSLLLSPGPHEVHVSKGNMAGRQIVNVVQGEANHVKIALAPADASLRVEATANGSEVRLDGKSIGKTPLAIKVPAGRHDVEIEGVGFPTAAVAVELDAGWETVVSADLGKGSQQVASQILHPSTWNTSRRVWGTAGILLVVYGFYQVDELNKSNDRQEKLKTDALAASNVSTYNDIVDKIKKERDLGKQYQANAQIGYGLGIAALALAWFASGPTTVQGENTRIQVSMATPPDGSMGSMVALRWNF